MKILNTLLKSIWPPSVSEPKKLEKREDTKSIKPLLEAYFPSVVGDIIVSYSKRSPLPSEAQKTTLDETQGFNFRSISAYENMLVAASSVWIKVWEIKPKVSLIKKYFGVMDSSALLMFDKNHFIYGYIQNNGEGGINIVNIHKGVVAKFIAHTFKPTSIVALGDQQHFASTSPDQTVKVWDLKGRCLQDLKRQDLLASRPSMLEENLLAVGAFGVIEMWEPLSGKYSKLETQSGDFVTCLAKFNNKHFIFFDGSINVWELDAQKPIHTFKPVFSSTGEKIKDYLRKKVEEVIVLSSDFIATRHGQDSEGIKFWDLTTKECVETISDGIRITLSSSGYYVIGKKDGSIDIYEMNSPE